MSDLDGLIERLRADISAGEGFADGPPSFEHIEAHADRLDRAWEALPTLLAALSTSQAEIVRLREAVSDAIATVAAVRATASSGTWQEPGVADHFYVVCGETLKRVRALSSGEKADG